MPLTIVNRPQGVVVSETGIAAAVEQDYMAPAVASVYSPGHGLPAHSWVYIRSRIENYNGFFKQVSFDANRFVLETQDQLSLIPYVGDVSITYYPQIYLHNVHAAFNPIVYKLKSDLWPVNSVDTVRTVGGFDDVSGYVRITASGSLGTFNTLDFIQISGAVPESINGSYQVVDKQSSSVVVINLAYDASYNFASSTIQLYRNNYCMVVRIMTGQVTGNPNETVVTIKLIPDSNNEVKFSIHNIIQAFINQRNNLFIHALPNNSDFWNGFRIAYSESFDVSGQTFTSSETVDSLSGVFVNAKLPFKNKYSGSLSNYIMINSLSKFLTLFAIPVFFTGCGDSCYSSRSTFLDPVNQWTNIGSGSTWFFSSSPVFATVELDTGPTLPDRTSKSLSDTIHNPFIGTYQFSITGSNSGSAFLTISLFDADGVFINGNAFIDLIPGGGSFNNLSVSISSLGQTPAKITINAVNTSGSSGNDVTLTKFIISNPVTFKTINPDGPCYQDLSFIMPANPVELQIKKEYQGGTGIPRTDFQNINDAGQGVYRVQLDIDNQFDTVGLTLLDDGDQISEVKTFKIDSGCNCDGIKLTWLNNIAGFEYWNFNGFKDNMISIGDTGETSVNLLPDWPNSYGEFADTDKRRQTFRDSKKQLLVRSQNLSRDQADALATIKSSLLVQIINDVYDKRTVIVDSDSLTVYNDGDKLFAIQFMITYTDDIPSQTV